MKVAKSSKNKSDVLDKKISFKISFKKILLFLSVFFVGVIGIVTAVLLLLNFYLGDKIYPFVKIGQSDVSFLTKVQALTKVKTDLSSKLNQEFTFEYQSSTQSANLQKFTIKLSPNSLDLNLEEIIDRSFNQSRSKLLLTKKDLSLEPTFKPSFISQLNSIKKQVNEEPVDSQIKMEDSGQIIVTSSQNGLVLNEQELKKQIIYYLNHAEILTNQLPIEVEKPKLSYDEAVQIKKRLDQIKLQPIRLNFKDLSFELNLEKILELIDLQNTQSSVISGNFQDSNFNISQIKIGNKETLDTKLTLNLKKVDQYLKELSGSINQEVREPLFNFDGTRVVEFRPPQEGRKLNLEKTSEKLSLALITQNQTEIELPVDVTLPKNKLSNDLGIKELVSQGVSNFAHSIENRIYNVNLGASKLNGILVSPGEVFSFNKSVGDITAATGFKQAYVIKSGRTVLDDGGGICQVSTTLFRAVLNAGLPIISRTPHAYRVQYYEQGFPPGLDATTYYPSVDFQFKNDTDHSLLIQAHTEGLTLYVDLYGTKDGRVVNISTPVTLSQTPPPPELRQDDPTLPRGTIKQVDWSAWGANVIFSRKVTKKGQQTINETFKSNYRPWQAVYLVGTKDG